MEKPAVTEESYMTTSEILNYLRRYTTLNLSERRMGEVLKKAGFLRKSKRIGGNPMNVYHIRKIVPNPFIQSYNTNFSFIVNDLQEYHIVVSNKLKSYKYGNR